MSPAISFGSLALPLQALVLPFVIEPRDQLAQPAACFVPFLVGGQVVRVFDGTTDSPGIAKRNAETLGEGREPGGLGFLMNHLADVAVSLER